MEEQGDGGRGRCGRARPLRKGRKRGRRRRRRPTARAAAGAPGRRDLPAGDSSTAAHQRSDQRHRSSANHRSDQRHRSGQRHRRADPCPLGPCRHRHPCHRRQFGPPGPRPRSDRRHRRAAAWSGLQPGRLVRRLTHAGAARSLGRRGHIDSAATGPSVFFRLGALVPGDTADVTLADGTVAVFTVTGVRQYPKSVFPTDVVYGNTDFAGLRLITCGGAFDPTTGHYMANTVVFASLTSSYRAAPASSGGGAPSPTGSTSSPPRS